MKPDKCLNFSKDNSNILKNFTWYVSSFSLIQREESLNIKTNFECLPKTKKILLQRIWLALSAPGFRAMRKGLNFCENIFLEAIKSLKIRNRIN